MASSGPGRKAAVGSAASIDPASMAGATSAPSTDPALEVAATWVPSTDVAQGAGATSAPSMEMGRARETARSVADVSDGSGGGDWRLANLPSMSIRNPLYHTKPMLPSLVEKLLS